VTSDSKIIVFYVKKLKSYVKTFCVSVSYDCFKFYESHEENWMQNTCFMQILLVWDIKKQEERQNYKDLFTITNFLIRFFLFLHSLNQNNKNRGDWLVYCELQLIY
jgi:hypothetical protein